MNWRFVSVAIHNDLTPDRTHLLFPSLGCGACGHAGVIIWISTGITAGHLSTAALGIRHFNPFPTLQPWPKDSVETEMMKLQHQLRTGGQTCKTTYALFWGKSFETSQPELHSNQLSLHPRTSDLYLHLGGVILKLAVQLDFEDGWCNSSASVPSAWLRSSIAVQFPWKFLAGMAWNMCFMTLE